MKIVSNSSNKPYMSTQNKVLILPEHSDLNLRKFSFTVDENTQYPLEVGYDTSVTSHYADPSAKIIIVPKTQIVTTAQYQDVIMAIGLNVSFDEAYQALCRVATRNMILATKPISTQTSANTYLQAKADGKIILFPYGTSYYFANGEYDLYFLW